MFDNYSLERKRIFLPLLIRSPDNLALQSEVIRSALPPYSVCSDLSSDNST